MRKVIHRPFRNYCAVVCVIFSISLAACDSGPGADLAEQFEAVEEVGLDNANFLRLVNEARSVSRQCGDDTLPAVAPVQWNEALRRAAHSHSNDMAEQNFFDHSGSDGSSVGTRVADEGYTWRSVGENIAAGYYSPESVVEGWLTSPGHCRNMMRGSYTEMGMALVELSGTRYYSYWTQVFALPSSQN